MLCYRCYDNSSESRALQWMRILGGTSDHVDGIKTDFPSALSSECEVFAWTFPMLFLAMNFSFARSKSTAVLLCRCQYVYVLEDSGKTKRVRELPKVLLPALVIQQKHVPMGLVSQFR